jgi:hypothetical protein
LITFVFSYFRAFVIDLISSQDHSFHDKRRGVEFAIDADETIDSIARRATVARKRHGLDAPARHSASLAPPRPHVQSPKRRAPDAGGPIGIPVLNQATE